MEYKLLTPGPLTTTMAVKERMLFDHCTWDDDYKQITCRICDGLLLLGHVAAPEYTAVLVQGNGTFGVESVLTSVIGADEKVLIAANGAYGLRMTDICRHAGIACTLYEQPNTLQPDAAHIAELLAADPSITHVSMVHSETTSGILNDIEAVGKVVKAAGKTFIVDAMSSFGGVDIPVADYGIDFLISSANKCIQGGTRLRLHPRTPREARAEPRKGTLAVARPVRAVEEHEHGRQVALYSSDARGHGVRQGDVGTRAGRRHSGAPCTLCRQPAPAGPAVRRNGLQAVSRPVRTGGRQGR